MPGLLLQPGCHMGQRRLHAHEQITDVEPLSVCVDQRRANVSSIVVQLATPTRPNKADVDRHACEREQLPIHSHNPTEMSKHTFEEP